MSSPSETSSFLGEWDLALESKDEIVKLKEEMKSMKEEMGKGLAEMQRKMEEMEIKMMTNQRQKKAGANEDHVRSMSANMNHLPTPMHVAQPTGIIDDAAFKFAAPKERKLSVPVVVEESENSASREPEEGSDENESSEEKPESDYEMDSDENGLDNKKEKKEDSRPLTSTYSERKSTATKTSSNNVSPMLRQKKQKSTKLIWECSVCYVSNMGSECVCCATKKGGDDDENTLFSNTFASAPSRMVGVTFGFAGGNTVSSTTPSFRFGSLSSYSTNTANPSSKTANPLSNGLATTATAPAPVPTIQSAVSTEKRADWQCPECFVNNKSTKDKCCVCGHVMNKRAGGAAANVFGDRGFNSHTMTENVLFGLGSTTSKPLFGFGTTPAAPAPAPSFGVPLKATKIQMATKNLPIDSFLGTYTHVDDLLPKCCHQGENFTIRTIVVKKAIFEEFFTMCYICDGGKIFREFWIPDNFRRNGVRVWIEGNKMKRTNGTSIQIYQFTEECLILNDQFEFVRV